MPNTHLVFVPARTTAWNQPLDIGYMRRWKSQLQNALSEMMVQTINGVSETTLSKSVPVMRFDLMPLLAQACRAVARQDHTKAWEHLAVNDEDDFDRLAGEASGLDRGELYTDKCPEKQACVERSRPTRRAPAMLGMTRRRRRRCSVRKRGERGEP